MRFPTWGVVVMSVGAAAAQELIAKPDYDETIHGLPATRYEGNRHCVDMGYDYGLVMDGCTSQSAKYFSTMATNPNPAQCAVPEDAYLNMLCSEPDGDDFVTVTMIAAVDIVVMIQGQNGGAIYSELKGGGIYSVDAWKREAIRRIEWCFDCEGVVAATTDGTGISDSSHSLSSRAFSGNPTCADFGYDYGWMDIGCSNGGKLFIDMDIDTKLKAGTTCDAYDQIGSADILCSIPSEDNHFKQATITSNDVDAVVIINGVNGGTIYDGLEAGHAYTVGSGENHEPIQNIEFCFMCSARVLYEPVSTTSLSEPEYKEISVGDSGLRSPFYRGFQDCADRGYDFGYQMEGCQAGNGIRYNSLFQTPFRQGVDTSSCRNPSHGHFNLVCSAPDDNGLSRYATITPSVDGSVIVQSTSWGKIYMDMKAGSSYTLSTVSKKPIVEIEFCFRCAPIKHVETDPPTPFPTKTPTGLPTEKPTSAPTTEMPTSMPTETPTSAPTTEMPTSMPTETPTSAPTTEMPTSMPTETPTSAPPKETPTSMPTETPTSAPTTQAPTLATTEPPTDAPTSSETPPRYPGYQNCREQGYDFGFQMENCVAGKEVQIDTLDQTPFREDVDQGTCQVSHLGGFKLVCTDRDMSNGGLPRTATITPDVDTAVMIQGITGGILYRELTAGGTYRLEAGDSEAITDIEFCMKCNRNKKPDKNGSGYGDPHIKTWGGGHFDFHGGCDLILVDSPNYSKGLGLRIHVRTKVTDWWSYIDSAVLQIGNDRLEVQGIKEAHLARYWVNGNPGPALVDGQYLNVTLGRQKIQYHEKSAKTKSFQLKDFSIETFGDFVRVNVHAKHERDFEGALGLMGSFPSGTKLGRDGRIIWNLNQFGMEWQVRSYEPMLFHSVEGVQHPQQCEIPSMMETKNLRRRRLREVLSREDAYLACAHVAQEFLKDCISDVVATDDRHMAYSENYQ
jgi:hypothetical protein